MPIVLTEKRHSGAFLASEAPGQLSRENIVVISGQNLGVGRVLGTIATGGKRTALAPAASDGSQNASGILWSARDATDGDKTGVAIVRSAEVISDQLDWGSMTTNQIATATAQLAALGVIVRPAL